MQLTLIIILVLLLIFISVFLYCWYKVRRTLNRHVPSDKKYESRFSLSLQKHNFKTEDNVSLEGQYIPVKDSKAVVVLVHGFTTDKGGKSYMLAHADYLNKAGYSVFLFDLRSYGNSEGNKITLGLNEWKDVEAAYDYVKNILGNKDKKVGFFGISMGATSAIITTGKTGKGDFLIASVPFASLYSLFDYQVEQMKLPTVVFSPFLKLAAVLELGLNYDALSAENYIGEIKVPVFIISAQKDQVLNPKDAKELFEQANEPKYFWNPDTGHDVFVEKPEEFKEKVLEWMDRVVGLSL